MQTIKILRKEKGLTLQNIADRCGMSKSHLSEIESGVKCPSIPMLHKLAKALDIPAWKILFAEEDLPHEVSALEVLMKIKNLP